MNKIFTFGDGFATGHIWPEWPQILQALLPNYEIINTAGIGAGQEFLISGLVDMLPSMHGQHAIIQWPDPARFDKLLQDQSWDSLITQDEVYHFNRVADSCQREWWLSSASKQTKQYHQHWVQSHQAIRRAEIFKTLVSHTLDNVKCNTTHTSTLEQLRYSRQPRFFENRQNQIQPSPIVHFYWVVEEIIPKMGIAVDPELQTQLENLINHTTWIAYNPEDVWPNILNQLIKTPRL